MAAHTYLLPTPVVKAARTRAKTAPARYVQGFLLIYSLGTVLRDYQAYSRYEHAFPGYWPSFLQGTGAAPEQYRIGVKLLAWWMQQAFGGGFRHSFALLDALSLAVACPLLYSCFTSERLYGEGSRLAQRFGSAVFVAVLLFYLAWLPSFERPETLPVTALTAASLWIWTRTLTPQGGRWSQAALAAVSLFLLGAALAFVRAEVACVLNLGLLLACAVRGRGRVMGLPGAWVCGLCLLAVGFAVGVQLYLVRVAYPHASYGRVPILMLPHELHDPLICLPFLLFLAPVLWTILRLRHDAQQGLFPVSTADLAIVFAALLYLPLWITLGKLDEVRIFLPFALALTPLTGKLALAHLRNTPALAGSSASLAPAAGLAPAETDA